MVNLNLSDNLDFAIKNYPVNRRAEVLRNVMAEHLKMRVKNFLASVERDNALLERKAKVAKVDFDDVFVDWMDIMDEVVNASMDAAMAYLESQGVKVIDARNVTSEDELVELIQSVVAGI